MSQILSTLFRRPSDSSLTRKASLNSLASALDYAARLLVGFLITPLMVAGLGDYFFGTWQTLINLIGYISPTSGRPTWALKWTLASQPDSTDYDQKRRYVGSAVAVWAIFLPIMVILGGVLAWFAPYWLSTPPDHFWYVRLTGGILVVRLVLDSLLSVPRSVLEGENLGYKRMGLSVIMIFLGGGLTWLALYLDMGMIGVAVAALTTVVTTNLFFLLVVRTHAPWFGVARPTLGAIRRFLGLSWWFLGWNTVMKLMMVSDVVVLGILVSAESVTTYTLTKYAPETLTRIVAIAVMGIAPGLGGIIGLGDLEKATRIRNEIMSLTWLLVTVLGAAIVVWNRTFVRLWVGEDLYAGAIPALLIVVVAVQFVFIMNDASIIDVTLRLRGKVLVGGLSVASALVIAGVLVSYFELGIVGLCLGFIAGRSILSVTYPMLVGRFLEISSLSQLKSVIRPGIVTGLLFLLATRLSILMDTNSLPILTTWLGLAVLGGATAMIALVLAFYTGLTSGQRRRTLQRLAMVLQAGS